MGNSKSASKAPLASQPKNEDCPLDRESSEIANTTGSASGGSASLSTQACIPPPPIEDHPPPLPVHPKPPVAEKKPGPHVASKIANTTGSASGGSASLSTQACIPPPPIEDHPPPLPVHPKPPVAEKKPGPHVASKETQTEVQKSLEIQESKWQERIKAKDVELKQIKAENLALVQQIERIQADSHKLLDITLANAESARIYLEDKYSAELSSSLMALQTETKECLERICPSVSIDNSLRFQDWLNEYQIQVGHLGQRKVLVLGLPPEQRKQFANKESQYEDFPQQAKSTCCTQRIKHHGVHPIDKEFPPIKKSKSLGSLQKKDEADKSLKRKLDPLEKQEEDLRLNVSDNLPHESCTICKALERKSKLNPIRILLNYTEYKDNKKVTLIVDTNILIQHMTTVEGVLSTSINESPPHVMVPFIVIKEMEKISKDDLKKDQLRSFMAREAMKKLEKVMKKYPNIVEQTLQQMKASSVWKSKQKNSDDIILECCIQVQKSGYNAVMWSEDKNLRIKILGHRILALSTTDVCEILSTKTLNPLEGMLRQNKEMRFISQVMKKVPEDIIKEIRTDPKNAIDILTGMHEIVVQPSEPLGDESTPTPSLEVDLNISTLFEPSQSGEKRPWTVVDDGDDDIY